jgi:peptidoglycan/xylan/chitin deacetylase (PgdA/CDA1 family)
MGPVKSKPDVELLPDINGKFACVTLDLENDWYLEEPGYDHLTFEYIDQYVDLITDLDLPVSVFVVGNTLESYPEGVETIQESIDSEFHLHSFSHDLTKSYDFLNEIEHGIASFESFFGRRPRGYRAPQGNITPEEVRHLDEAGFEFDSSVFPSYRPGIYNNLAAPIRPYRPPGTDQLIEYPIGAVPKIRIPLSQSYLKLLGRPYLWALKRLPLPDMLVFDSHLQDFFRTASHDRLDIPIRQIHKRNLSNSIELFRKLVRVLRDRGYEFMTLSHVHDRERVT